MDPSLSLNLLIFLTKLSPTGITEQQTFGMSLFIHTTRGKILTAYLTLFFAELVIQGRTKCQQVQRFNPCCIVLTLTNNQVFLKSIQNSLDFQTLFTDYYGRIENHYLADKLWDFLI